MVWSVIKMDRPALTGFALAAGLNVLGRMHACDHMFLAQKKPGRAPEKTSARTHLASFLPWSLSILISLKEYIFHRPGR